MERVQARTKKTDEKGGAKHSKETDHKKSGTEKEAATSKVSTSDDGVKQDAAHEQPAKADKDKDDEKKLCCAFEPFASCGNALNISDQCDISKKHCEDECSGRWLPLLGSQKTEPALSPVPEAEEPAHAPEKELTPTSTPELAKEDRPCCAFEPLKGCGTEVGISETCDVSRRTCEDVCVGRWLEHGAKENPDGIDVYEEWLPVANLTVNIGEQHL